MVKWDGRGRVPIISCRRRYWPDGMQDGIVKLTLPLFAIMRSTPQVWSEGLRPSSQILNHLRPVTSLCVASGICALWTDEQMIPHYPLVELTGK